MKALTLAAALALALPGADDPQDLVGTWTVDLRPTPDAPAYAVPLIVAAVDGDRIQGTFYGSPITESEVTTDWGGVRFAFVTTDASARYVTSGHLEDGALTGTTYSPDRDLLQPWTAVRAE